MGGGLSGLFAPPRPQVGGYGVADRHVDAVSVLTAPPAVVSVALAQMAGTGTGTVAVAVHGVAV